MPGRHRETPSETASQYRSGIRGDVVDNPPAAHHRGIKWWSGEPERRGASCQLAHAPPPKVLIHRRGASCQLAHHPPQQFSSVDVGASGEAWPVEFIQDDKSQRQLRNQVISGNRVERSCGPSLQFGPFLKMRLTNRQSRRILRTTSSYLLGDATAVESKTSKGWRLEDLADFD